MYDNYESGSELDMLDFQEQTVEPHPLFANGGYHEEINYSRSTETIKQQFEELIFPTSPVYDDYESDPGESQGEEPEEQSAFRPEPVGEQPLPEISEPTKIFHSPVLVSHI